MSKTEPLEQTARRSRGIKPTTVIKLVVTVGLSAFVLSRAGVEELVDTLGNVDWRWVLLAICLAASAMVINVGRWQLMLRGQSAKAPLPSLIRLYLVGMFFNNVLPSRLGGDVVRAYGASLIATTKTRSAAAVIMDRLVGAFSVLVIGMMAIGLSASRLPEIRPRFEAAIDALRSYSRMRGVVAQGFLISLVANGFSIFNLYLYARAVQADVGFGDVATIAPIILAVGLLPISINGIGTIEATFMLLFGTLGVDAHVSIVMAILRRLALLVLSLAGGVLYAARRFS
jgi:uncharacterized membrane protein YbhN (UPF0104 family)